MKDCMREFEGIVSNLQDQAEGQSASVEALEETTESTNQTAHLMIEQMSSVKHDFEAIEEALV